MGKLEKESVRKRKRSNLQKAVLMSVAAAGFLSMAIVAPNALQALAKLGIIDTRSPRRKELINRARDRLLATKFLERDGKGFLRLTPKGEAKLRQLELSGYRLRKPKRWDQRWRVLVFDIPEHRKTLRDKVRRTLLAIGFQRLQDSVWVYPYDCEDLIALLKTDFKVGKDLIYIITDAIEGDSGLRERFNLSLAS